jgi:hypothetical protein
MPGDNRLGHISFLLGAWVTILPAAPCAWPQEVSGSTSAVKALPSVPIIVRHLPPNKLL